MIFPKAVCSTQHSPNLFDLRNSYLTEQMLQTLWEEILIELVCNGKH